MLVERVVGVSVENRKSEFSRIEHFRAAPAYGPFLSVELLLEGIGKFELDGISWVIVGGDSDPGARPLHRAWVTSVRETSLKTPSWSGRVPGCVAFRDQENAILQNSQGGPECL